MNEVTSRVRELFDAGESISRVAALAGLSRTSVKHYHIEWKQDRNQDASAAHSQLKADLSRIALGYAGTQKRVLELFSGSDGFMTKVYEQAGCRITALDKRNGTGDSYIAVHRLIAERKVFDLIDIDPYGYPFRLFPHVYQLINNGAILVTIPKSGCNHGSNITWQMLQAFTGSPSPSLEQILLRMWEWGLQHWRDVALVRGIDFGRVWRILLSVRRVKATEYCNVRNRPEMPPTVGTFRTAPEPFEAEKKIVLATSAGGRRRARQSLLSSPV